MDNIHSINAREGLPKAELQCEIYRLSEALTFVSKVSGAADWTQNFESGEVASLFQILGREAYRLADVLGEL